MRNSTASPDEPHRWTKATNRLAAGARATAKQLCWMDRLIVRLCAGSAQAPFYRAFATACSWLGNGLIYPILAAVLVLLLGLRSIAVIAVAVVSIGLLHCFYPFIKRRAARPRPYRADDALTPLLDVLDEHSFPSGHAMTLTAALVPFVLAFPPALFGAAILWGFFAWARIACAHHYPSDILAGTAMGFILSYLLFVYGLDPLTHVLIRP